MKKNKIHFAANFHFFLYLALAVIAFGNGLFFYFIESPFPLFLGIYLLIGLVITIFLGIQIWKKENLLFSLITWISLVLFGPLGAFCYLCGVPVFLLSRTFTLPFEKWYASLFPDLEFIHVLSSKNSLESAKHVDPIQQKMLDFQDVLYRGTREEKQAALDKVAKEFHPELIPILKMGLDDASDQIRVQTASILSQITHAFESKKSTLLEEIQKNSSNPHPNLQLATYLEAYISTGLLEGLKEKENQELVIASYKQYIEKQPHDSKAWMDLGRFLNKINAFDHIILWFEEREHIEAKNSEKIYAWYWEALYMLHQFNKLTESARKTYQTILKSDHQKELFECVQLWAAQESQ